MSNKCGHVKTNSQVRFYFSLLYMAKVTTNPLARGAMRFWDSGNFESLLAVSAALKDDERCVELAEYCRLREKGLRAAAFTALAKFIERTEKYDRDERIDLSEKY